MNSQRKTIFSTPEKKNFTTESQAIFSIYKQRNSPNQTIQNFHNTYKRLRGTKTSHSYIRVLFHPVYGTEFDRTEGGHCGTRFDYL